MFYWFSRGDETLQYEVREISATRFELTITLNGVKRLEVFDSADALHQRQLGLERELSAQGWVGPHGWNV